MFDKVNVIIPGESEERDQKVKAIKFLTLMILKISWTIILYGFLGPLGSLM